MKCVKIAALAAASVILITACSDDQTEFNVNKIPGKCVIEGNITYNEGTTINEETGKFEYAYKPLADTEIYVKVNNDVYNTTAKPDGYQKFKVRTDAEGNYRVEIPATDKRAEATIVVPDFKGTRTVVKKINNEVVTEQENVVYLGEATVTIHGDGIVYKNFRCTECNHENVLRPYEHVAALTCKIGKGVEYVTPYEKVTEEVTMEDADGNSVEATVFRGYNNATLYYRYEPAASADIILTVTGNNGATMTFNATTDKNGEFTVDVPVVEFPASFSYAVQVMPWDANFTHYESETLYYFTENTLYDNRDEAVEARKAAIEAYNTAVANGDANAKYPADLSEVLNYKKAEKAIPGYFSQNGSINGSAYYPVAGEVCGNMNCFSMVFHPFSYVTNENLFGYNSSNFTFSDAYQWLADLIKQLEEAKEANN